MLKNSDRSPKFLKKFWRPFTSFDTQIWWSIANLMLKKSDRSLKFLEKFWRPFTSFDTQIWWSIANLVLKNSIDRYSFRKNFEDHLQVLTHKFGGRRSIANLMLKNCDRSLKFLEKFWRPFASFDTQIWWSMIDRKFRRFHHSSAFWIH